MKKSIAGIIYRNGRFLIGHRLETGEMSGRWEFPGGKVDAGESPEETIRREFREEMSIDAEPLYLLTTTRFSNRHGDVELQAWCIDVPETFSPVLTEHSEISWATLDEIEQLEFVDSDLLLLPFLRNWVVKGAPHV